MTVDVSRLVPIEQMRGDDDEDTKLLGGMFGEATSFLQGFRWCSRIEHAYFGLGIGGAVAVFLFQIDASPGVDHELWVVVGDLPTAYLVTDDAPTAVAALEVYCSVMSDWVSAVEQGRPLNDVYPVRAPATLQNASLLMKRIQFLRTRIIPMYKT